MGFAWPYHKRGSDKNLFPDGANIQNWKVDVKKKPIRYEGVFLNHSSADPATKWVKKGVCRPKKESTMIMKFKSCIIGEKAGVLITRRS